MSDYDNEGFDLGDVYRSFEKSMDRADRYHRKLESDMDKLRAEPCLKFPKVGDRVIVAAGLLGMGHEWIRREAIVLECGDTNYKVQFTDYFLPGNKMVIEWIAGILITDVLETATNK
jgi:hypothetical protein